jgi:hypothetical protein
MSSVKAGPTLDPDALPGHVDGGAREERFGSGLTNDLELARSTL